MESKPARREEFDAEKVMDMTREEAIAFLGDENANRVNEGLKMEHLVIASLIKYAKKAFQ